MANETVEWTSQLLRRAYMKVYIRAPAVSWRVSPDLLPPKHPPPTAHLIWEIIPDHDRTAAMQVGFSSVAFDLLSEYGVIETLVGRFNISVILYSLILTGHSGRIMVL